MDQSDIIVTVFVVSTLVVAIGVAVVRELRRRARRDRALWRVELSPGTIHHQLTLRRPSTGLFFDVKAVDATDLSGPRTPRDFFIGDWPVRGARLTLRVASESQVFLNRTLRVPLDLANAPDSYNCGSYEITQWLEGGLWLPAGVPLTIDGNVEVVANTDLQLLRIYLVA